MTRLRREEAKRPPKFGDAVASLDDQYPAFCLNQLQRGYCVWDCSKEQRAAFATRLRELSQLTWVQLKMAPRHGCGFEKIDRVSFRVAIPGHLTDDTVFLSFRCFGMAPMIGYRKGVTFFLLWLDRNFSVYRH